MSLRDELLQRFPRLRDIPPGASRAVGGAVRDLHLGREPKDVDVECYDPRAFAESLGRKVVHLGRDNITVFRVVEGDHIYDFSLLTSLKRRDFTINSIAVDLTTGELQDQHGGADDIARRMVRMIEAKNFDDDPLRLLRAVRFAVTLGFLVDETTAEAIRARAANIKRVAWERVEYELAVTFSARRFRRALQLLRATALDVPLFGFELDASQFRADDVSLAAAYTLLRHVPPGPIAREIAALQQLVERHDRIALYDAGEQVATQLPALLRALGRDDRLDLPDFSIRALLTGDEIADLTGVDRGPRLGAIKRAMLEAQIRGKIATREEAVTFVNGIVSTDRDS